MNYISIPADRCLNIKEKILKPFLCEDCGKLPIKCYKSLKNQLNYYCGDCIKKKNNKEIVEENLKFDYLLISCIYRNCGCDQEFYYGNIERLSEHEETCSKREVKGRFQFNYYLSSNQTITKTNKKVNKKRKNKLEAVKANYEEKLTKIIDKYEDEKRKLEKKVEFLTNQNLLLEINLHKKSNLMISKEIQIEYLKSIKKLNYTQPITVTILSSKKENLIRSLASSLEISKKQDINNTNQTPNINDQLLQKGFQIPPSNSNLFGHSNDLKNNESKFSQLHNNILSSRLSNSLLSTNLSLNNNDKPGISLSLMNGKPINPISNSILLKNEDNISKTQVNTLTPEKLNEIKSVLNKMDCRYFDNFNLLEKLNSNHLTKLGDDIRKTMSACGKDYIPTKSNGTMDMRFSVNKDLVALFKSYDLLSQNY